MWKYITALLADAPRTSPGIPPNDWSWLSTAQQELNLGEKTD
jgi:hypothetical protein